MNIGLRVPVNGEITVLFQRWYSYWLYPSKCSPDGAQCNRGFRGQQSSPGFRFALSGLRSQVTGEPTTMKKATITMKKNKSGSQETKVGDSPSRLIDARIKELRDWRGEML